MTLVPSGLEVPILFLLSAPPWNEQSKFLEDAIEVVEEETLVVREGGGFVHREEVDEERGGRHNKAFCSEDGKSCYEEDDDGCLTRLLKLRSSNSQQRQRSWSLVDSVREQERKLRLNGAVSQRAFRFPFCKMRKGQKVRRSK